jgi:chromosome segregation ATPase
MAEENDKILEDEKHATSFVERLQQASNDIDSIKTSFSKGMEELARIQNVLSLDGMNKVNTMIQDFEDRLTNAERKKEEAMEGARKYSEELEKEKERLVKLWDAYKNQEEELSSQEKKALDLEQQLKDVEQSKSQLEEDTTARINTLTMKMEEKEQQLQQFDETKQRIEDFDAIRNRLEESIHDLKNDISKKEETINTLEAQVENLKSYEKYSEFKTKFEEVSEEYEKEKDRLTKLFRLYEETEAENKRLKQEIEGWQAWFNSNEDLFTKLFSSADHLVKSKSSSTTKNEPKEENKLETKEDKKKRRKLRFKK